MLRVKFQYIKEALNSVLIKQKSQIQVSNLWSDDAQNMDLIQLKSFLYLFIAETASIYSLVNKCL
jgi:hypothetical protein